MTPGLLADIEPNRCNCLALRKATRRMSQFYDSALAPSGLRGTQYSILVDLVRRGDAPPTIRELSEAMVLDQSTIGQNLRPLEREGLIALVPDPADRRSRRIKLTKAGRARLRRGAAALERRTAAIRERLWQTRRGRAASTVLALSPAIQTLVGERRARSRPEQPNSSSEKRATAATCHDPKGVKP